MGFDLSDNITALAEKLHSQILQKLANVVFTVHQKKQKTKKLDYKFIKKLNALDQEVVPPKMNVQFYCNKVILWLKTQYDMV